LAEIHSPVVGKFAKWKKDFAGRGVSLEVIWIDVSTGSSIAFTWARFYGLGSRKCLKPGSGARRDGRGVFA
jgi:hypothetical protein